MGPEAYLDEACVVARDLKVDFVGLSTLISVVTQDGLRPSKKRDVYLAQVAPYMDLQSLLFTPGSIDEDLRLALMVQITGLPDWDDKPEQESVSTQDYALARAALGAAPVRLVLSHFDGGTVDRGVHVASDILGIRRFYRALPEILDLDEESYVHNCSLAHPRLRFRQGIASQIRRFSRSYREIRPTLSKALTALNDHLTDLLDANVPHTELGARFEALSGFGLSPESPRTHRNAAAMTQRDVHLGTHTIRCEWHLKIEPNRDRIYLSFYSKWIGDGQQIFVGIFCEHLPT